MPTVELCSGPRVTRAGRGREALGTLLLLIKPRDGSLHAALHLQVCLLSTCTRCVVPPTRVGRLVCKEHCAVAVLPSWRNIVLTIDRDAHEPAPGRPDRLTEPRQPPPNDSVVAPFSAMGCTKLWRGATHRNTPPFWPEYRGKFRCNYRRGRALWKDVEPSRSLLCGSLST